MSMNSNNKVVYYKCMYRCKLCGSVIDVAPDLASKFEVKGSQGVHYTMGVGRKFCEDAQSLHFSYVVHACEFNEADVPTKIGICEFIGLQIRD